MRRTPRVATAIRDAVERRERLAVDAGMDLLGNNPGPTNIAGGLSTIEEKSLGAIAKGGSSPIRGVIGIAQPPPGPGLFVMDAPAYAPESVTGLVAVGRAARAVHDRCRQQLRERPRADDQDLRESGGDRSTARAARLRRERRVRKSRHRSRMQRARLTALMTEVASGTLTWGEILDEGEDVVSRLGPAL